MKGLYKQLNEIELAIERSEKEVNKLKKRVGPLSPNEVAIVNDLKDARSELEKVKSAIEAKKIEIAPLFQETMIKLQQAIDYYATTSAQEVYNTLESCKIAYIDIEKFYTDDDNKDSLEKINLQTLTKKINSLELLIQKDSSLEVKELSITLDLKVVAITNQTELESAKTLIRKIDDTIRKIDQPKNNSGLFACIGPYDIVFNGKKYEEQALKKMLKKVKNQILSNIKEVDTWGFDRADKTDKEVYEKRVEVLQETAEDLTHIAKFIKLEADLVLLTNRVNTVPDDADGYSIQQLEKEIAIVKSKHLSLKAIYKAMQMPNRAKAKSGNIIKLIAEIELKINQRRTSINQEYKHKHGSSELGKIEDGYERLLGRANKASTNFNTYLFDLYNAVDVLGTQFSNGKTKQKAFQKDQAELDANIKLVTDAALSLVVTAIAAPLGSLAAIGSGSKVTTIFTTITDNKKKIIEDLAKDLTKQGVKIVPKLFKVKISKASPVKTTPPPSFAPSIPSSGFTLVTNLKVNYYKQFEGIAKYIDDFRQTIANIQKNFIPPEVLAKANKEQQQELIKNEQDGFERIASEWDTFHDVLKKVLSKKPNVISKAKAHFIWYYFSWCSWISTWRKDGFFTPDHKIILKGTVIDEMDHLGFFKESGANKQLFDSFIEQGFDAFIENFMPTLTGAEVSKLVDFANRKIKEYNSSSYWKDLLGI